jgi:hypothetical protein
MVEDGSKCPDRGMALHTAAYLHVCRTARTRHPVLVCTRHLLLPFLTQGLQLQLRERLLHVGLQDANSTQWQISRHGAIGCTHLLVAICKRNYSYTSHISTLSGTCTGVNAQGD